MKKFFYRLNEKVNNLFNKVSNNSDLYQRVSKLVNGVNNINQNNISALTNRVSIASTTFSYLSTNINSYINEIQCLSNSQCIPTPSTTSTIPAITTTLVPITNSTDCDKLLDTTNGKISSTQIQDITCNWSLKSSLGNKYILTLKSLIIQQDVELEILNNVNNSLVLFQNTSISEPIQINDNGYDYTISIKSANSFSGVQFELDFTSQAICSSDTCFNNGTCDVGPDNKAKCTCSGCYSSDSNCQRKYNPCDTYKKCKTLDSNDNPTGNTCQPLETTSSCVAKCYCNGSSTASAFCS
uniref:EGF-like domain-containing protein n=1 Tax=Parastrongyloides trichosuri TaxID=131310 RepID=A0A0N4Z0G9_PARTI